LSLFFFPSFFLPLTWHPPGTSRKSRRKSRVEGG
jgi:hypothetical protein